MNKSLLIGLGVLVLTVGAPAWSHGREREEAEEYGASRRHEDTEGGEARRSGRERGERTERRADRGQENAMSDEERMTRMMALGAAVEQAQVIETVRMIQALDLSTEQGGRFAALMEEAQNAGREHAINRGRLMTALSAKVRSNANDGEVSQALADLRAADAAYVEWEKTHSDQVVELLGPQKAARFLLLRAAGPSVRVGGVRRNPNAAAEGATAPAGQSARRSGARRATAAPAASAAPAGR